MMENKSPFDNAVALVRYRPDTNSLAMVFDLSRASRHFTRYPNSQQTKKHPVEKNRLKPPFNPKTFFERGKNNGIQDD